jgi:hypothetical protein
MKRSLVRVFVLVSSVMFYIAVRSDAAPNNKHESRLQIGTDSSGNVVVSWTGKGELHEATGRHGKYKKVHKSSSPYVVAPTETEATYRLSAADGGVVSQNAVGYVNLSLPPGLSLIANPLAYTNNSLAFWLPNPPAGAQVYKYTADNGYEVSTFDEIDGVWSNPDLQVPIGVGFFFRNPSSTSFTQMFVGEVPQGWLTNSLPQGYSTKGSLVPVSDTLKGHGIPGEPGDEIRTYTNDLQGGGDYNISSYIDSQVGWQPDLLLDVGQGFWIYKQNPQDWVRYFSVN